MSVRDATRLGVRLRALMGRGRSRKPTRGEGALLGRAENGHEVVLPRPTSDQAHHAYAFAATSAGKSIMLASALVDELVADPTMALIAEDPKGDLEASLINGLAARAPARLADLVILDPFDPKGGYPFNLCRLPLGTTPVDVRAIQLAGLVATVSTATGAQAHLGAGARQLQLLTELLLAAQTTGDPRASVLWALDALTQRNGMKALASITASARAKDFLASVKLQDELRVSTASRLRSGFGATEHLERMMSADGCIDIASRTLPGKVTIFAHGRPTGGMVSRQQFHANLDLRLVVDHLLQRPSPWRGNHCRLVIDEVQLVAPALADLMELLLTTGRSRGISVVAASQGSALIRDASPTLLQVLMGNSPTRLIGRLAAPDAELLARELTPAKGVDESLSSVRTRFVATVTNLPNRHFIKLSAGEATRFVSADVDLPAWEAAAEHEAPAIDRARYGLRLSDTGPRVTLLDAVKKAAASPRRRTRPEEPVAIDRDPAPETDEDPDQSPEPETSTAQPRSRWG